MKENFDAYPWAREKLCHDAAAPKVAFRFAKKAHIKFSADLKKRIAEYNSQHAAYMKKKMEEQ